MWDLRYKDRVITISAGTEILSTLASGIRDIAAGKGDWGIGDDHEMLTFWSIAAE
ncbi:MAG: hypothetical protein Phyf2KO_01000 [Phycisphaerales bacterium]